MWLWRTDRSCCAETSLMELEKYHGYEAVTCTNQFQANFCGQWTHDAQSRMLWNTVRKICRLDLKKTTLLNGSVDMSMLNFMFSINAVEPRPSQNCATATALPCNFNKATTNDDMHASYNHCFAQSIWAGPFNMFAKHWKKWKED